MEKTERWSKLNLLLIGLYLAAIVIANIAVARFGQIALIFTAFCLIPFDLCTRDVLHERWNSQRLFVKMFCLIGTGSLLSFILYRNSGRVALASMAAFGCAGIVDGIVYAFFEGSSRLWKMNASNFFSSITDSIIFSVIAFGSTTIFLSGGQAFAKFIGGIAWSLFFLWVLRWRSRRDVYDQKTI